MNELETQIQERITYLKRDVEGDIKSYTERIATLTKRLPEIEKETRAEFETRAEILKALDPIKDKVEITTFNWSRNVAVRIKPRQLKAVVRLVGHINVQNVEKDIEDRKKRTICVTLKTRKYGDALRISYVRRLKPTDPCKIERTRSVSHSLVCKR
jgi:hypothetical protein